MHETDAHQVVLHADHADPEWSVRGVTLKEDIGAPYLATVELVHPDVAAEAGALLGTSVALALRTGSAEHRVVGIVSRLRESTAPYVGAEATLIVEPALAALRHRRDSRIFQGKTVPEILEEVLTAGLAPFGRAVRLELEASYPPREYTVQYRETDFDFVHRLMEEEGILYRFDHDGDAEELVLLDAARLHPPVQGDDDERVRFDEASRSHAAFGGQAVRRFELVGALRPTGAAVRAFDWTHPSVPVEGADDFEDDAAALEEYEHELPMTFHQYAGTYGAHDAARKLELLRERQARDTRRAEGVATAPCLRAGRRFELYGHPQPDVDGAYTLVSAEHRWLEHASEAGSPHVVRFACVPAPVPYRPLLLRDRPRIGGVQTATVVGPAGAEIHADPHGRVKVQFHWDRLGQRDERSSCWIRVAQAMGGPGWGFAFVPRIGMEVVVAFLEGDPDRPLVVGAVYNSENPCPLALPDEKTRTTIRSQTSPGGGGSSELQFEDRAGEEYIFIHAQKDWNTLVLNDVTEHVRRDEQEVVARDRAREVGRDEKLEVGHDRTKVVHGEQRETIGENRIREVGRDETVAIGKNQTVAVAGDRSVRVGEDAIATIALDAAQTVGGDTTVTVQKNVTTQVLGNDQLQVGGSQSLKVASNASAKTGGAQLDRVAKNLNSVTGGSSTDRTARSRIRTVKEFEQERILGGRSRDSGRFHGETVGGYVKQVDATAAHTLSSATFFVSSFEHHVKAGGNLSVQAGADMTRTVGTQFVGKAGEGTATLTLAADGNVTIEVSEQLALVSTGEVRVRGAEGMVVKSGQGVKIDGGTVKVG
jgi:type VI secretion system secreted protein VgrG